MKSKNDFDNPWYKNDYNINITITLACYLIKKISYDTGETLEINLF